MRWLLFLSRLSFICGFFFLLSISLRFYNWTHDEVTTSTVIVIGYFMGLILVPVTNLCYLAVWVIKRKLKIYVPRWLIIMNILFLLLEYLKPLCSLFLLLNPFLIKLYYFFSQILELLYTHQFYPELFL